MPAGQSPAQHVNVPLHGPNQVYEIKSKNSEGLYISAHLLQKPISCLVDTGATISVLHSRFYNSIPDHVRPRLMQDCGQLKGADGEIIKQLGVANFPLQINKKIVLCRMIVAEIEVAAILGFDFLKEHHCEMKVGKGILTLNGEVVTTLLQDQVQSVFKLSVAENVVIPAASEIILPTKVDGDIPYGSSAVVEMGVVI